MVAATQQIMLKSMSMPACNEILPDTHLGARNLRLEPEAEPQAHLGHFADLRCHQAARTRKDTKVLVSSKLLRARSCPVVNCGVQVQVPSWLDVLLRTLRGGPARALRAAAFLGPAVLALAIVYRRRLAHLAGIIRKRTKLRLLLLTCTAWCARESSKFPRHESARSVLDGLRMIAQFFGDLLLAPIRSIASGEVPALRYQPSEDNLSMLSKCPSLKHFKQTPLLRNPWLALGVLMVRDFTGNDTRLVRRELIEADDGGILAIDWWAASADLPQEAPILFVGTTFTGDALPTISRCVMGHFAAHGWRCVAFTKRGCGLTMPNLQPPDSDRSWCFGGLDDLSSAIDFVAASFPEARVCGVGFSLGAAQLRSYMCATGDNCKLAACVCMDASPEWVSCVDSLDRRIPLVTRILKQAAIRCLENCADVEKSPQESAKHQAPHGDIFSLVQKHMAPRHGYGGSEHGALRYLLACNPPPYRCCKRPVLELLNYTDLLVDVSSVQQIMALFPAESQRVICCATKGGTHVVRWEGLKMRCWTSQVALEFLTAALEQAD